MESLEVGSRVLLVDEDTAATNFMIRSAAMQRLVAPEKEPITPFIAKVRPLAEVGPESGMGAQPYTSACNSLRSAPRHWYSLECYAPSL